MSNTPAGHVSWPDSFDDAPLSSSSERRKHARTKLIATTAIVLDANSRPATVVDLSEGGVGVRSDAVLEQGVVCRLQLAVPNSSLVIEAACELAWKRAPHAGFRFTILTEKSQRQIKEWLSAVHSANRNGSPPESALMALVDDVVVEEKTTDLSVVSDEALLNLAIKARDFTHADGVAVAAKDSEGMVCRASLGSAPEVGVRLRSDSGLSGECLRSGEIVVCYDSETDPRVDSGVACGLNMRSAVIVPIGRHETPAGLLEVFFATPKAFNEAAIYALQDLASGFPFASESAHPAATPEASPSAAGLPKMASFAHREAAPGCVICDVCGRENSDANQACDGCDVPLPTALRYVDLNSPQESEKPAWRRNQTYSEPAQPPRRSHGKKLLMMLLVALIAAAWQARGRIKADGPPSATRLEAESPAPQLQDKPLELVAPAPKPNQLAKKTAEPAEPEVTVRTFTSQPKQQNAKASAAKTITKKQNAKATAGTSTVPETSVAKVMGAEADQAGEQPILLPLNDQEALSAVAAPPPAPVQAKPKQPSVWKRIGKRLIWSGAKPQTEKK